MKATFLVDIEVEPSEDLLAIAEDLENQLGLPQGAVRPWKRTSFLGPVVMPGLEGTVKGGFPSQKNQNQV